MIVLKEFKEFAVKGNVIDLAVGVVLGSAFSKIVSSLVNDIIMPIISVLTGGINFTYLKLIIKRSHGDIPAVTLNYGIFIQNLVDFLIIAFSIFLFIKLINRLKREKKIEIVEVKEEHQKPSDEVLLLQEIRDLLKK
ncbi:large-conductance mechanosensitive channel protein MscL [Caldicellulosiruptoraceae bacterium PP1]